MKKIACRTALTITLVAFWMAVVSVPFASAQQQTLTRLMQREQNVKDVLSQVSSAVVAVSDNGGWGSGTIVSGDGIILTAGHVVMNSESGLVGIVLPDGQRTTAEVLGQNLKTDAGLLKLKSNTYNGKPWPHVELGSSASVNRGDWILSLGHPGGLTADVPITERPAPLRMGRVLSIGSRTIVTDGTIIVGDSGGPLFDLDGRLIGVHSMIGSDITNNRHVLVDVIRRDWARLEDGERWGELGDFDTGLVSSLLFGTELVWNEYDARVRSVVPGSPARRAGIRAGDQLVKVDGQAIADPLELSLILGERSPGDRITTEVKRDNEIVKLRVTLGPHPGRTEDPQYPIRKKPGKYEKAGRFALAEFRPVVDQNRGATVEFFDAEDSGSLLSLGTVVAADGYIATKYSEVDDAKKLTCRLGSGEELAAKVLVYEREFDVALVKIDAGSLRPVTWQTAPAEIGQIVVSPSRNGEPVASGVISVQSRKLAKAFLGVSGERGVRQRRRGARIGGVVEDSAAERAGLRQGDLILQVNNRTVSGFGDLVGRVGTFKPGQTITVKVERATGPRTAEIISIEVTLSGRFVAADWRRGFEQENLLGPALSAHSGGFPIALQHDTVMSANQCGGPLLNIKGEAIGINIARAGRVLSYAIPAGEAKKLVEALITKARNTK